MLGEYFAKGITYDAYMAAFEKNVAEKRTSGTIQTEELIHYTAMNLVRSKRTFKYSEIQSDLLEVIGKINRKIHIICITEFWCGDSSHVAPAVELIAEQTDMLAIRYLYRDENLELMDKYLTNGGRSIPKYILFDAETGMEITTWGPRPAAAQRVFLDLKQANASYDEIKEKVQRWYNADKTLSLQKEWISLISTYLL